MLHTIPLAYKYVMSVAMIAFVNHYAPRLNMPFTVPLQKQEIKLGVQPPEYDEIYTMYGGGVRIKNYEFGFADSHVNNKRFVGFTSYFTIIKLDEDGKESLGAPPVKPHESSNSIMERVSRMKYTVSTNDLNRMGTNYLMALDIDPKSAGTNNLLIVKQGIFHSNRGLVPSPLMNIYWKTSKLRDPGSSGVACLISAVNGDLLEMSAGNACGCKGLPLIKDLNKLIAIPDEEFLKYSDAARSNLIDRFVTCPSLITPEAESLGLFSTTNRFSKTKVPPVKP